MLNQSMLRSAATSLFLFSILAGCAGHHPPSKTETLISGIGGRDFNGLSFPGKIALAAFGNRPSTSAAGDATEWRQALIDACSRSPRCAGGESRSGIAQKLTCVFGSQSGANSPEPGLREELIKKAVEKAAENVTGLDAQQRRRAVELLRSGEFAEDIANSVGTVLTRINPDLIPKVIANVPDRLRSAPQLLDATAKDIAGGRASAAQCLANLRRLRGILSGAGCGTAETKPAVFGNTLREIYRSEVAKAAADTVSALIAADNETLRLAIIAYANMNGVSITEQDLDTLRASLLKTDDPDLGPLLQAGITSLVRQTGVDQAKDKILAMQADGNNSCSAHAELPATMLVGTEN